MKKSILTIAIASMLFTGCYGSYTLTSKLHKWTGETGAEPIPTIINWVALLIGTPIVAVDFLILNTIEYWSGSNPLAMDEGISDSQVVTTADGMQYRIQATKNKFEIFEIHAESEELVMEAVYSELQQNWTMTAKSGAQIATKINEHGEITIVPIKAAI